VVWLPAISGKQCIKAAAIRCKGLCVSRCEDIRHCHRHWPDLNVRTTTTDALVSTCSRPIDCNATALSLTALVLPRARCCSSARVLRAMRDDQCRPRPAGRRWCRRLPGGRDFAAVGPPLPRPARGVKHGSPGRFDGQLGTQQCRVVRGQIEHRIVFATIAKIVCRNPHSPVRRLPRTRIRVRAACRGRRYRR
jgi:hypothetical protein